MEYEKLTEDPQAARGCTKGSQLSKREIRYSTTESLKCRESKGRSLDLVWMDLRTLGKYT